MKCIIVEDEQNAAEHLEYLLRYLRPDVTIEAKIDSVKGAVLWLNKNQADLIFLDVQLGDGLSFSIFDHVDVITPVIFTTSYDKYALDAFKLNSISYLLKPIDVTELKTALNKFDKLTISAPNLNQLARIQNQYQKKFLIESGNTIHSFADLDIAYFMVQNRHVFLILNNGQHLICNATMDALEQRLDPALFFRINRQFIVNRNSIHKMTTETRGRVRIEMQPASKDEMIVSIDRANAFKDWLAR
jgi:two-component system, LytTR family, response regulator LytT